MRRGERPLGGRHQPTTYHVTVPATGEQLTGLRRGLRSWARDHGVPGETVHSIELASYEAMANVAEHAYVDDHDGELLLNATAHVDRLDVVVSDQGAWRDHENDSARGLGLGLIHRLADHTKIDTGRHGTIVSMTWFR